MHTGRSSVAGPGVNAQVLWKRSLGASESSPVIAPGGDILIGTSTGMTRFAPDGSTRWSQAYANTYATPAIAPDGTSYTSALFNSTSGRGVISYDNAGALRWESQPPPLNTRTLSSPLMLSDGSVLFALANYGLINFRTDGSINWSRQTNRYYIGSPALSADGSTIYVGDESSVFMALNSLTGNTVWSVSRRTRSSPAVGSDGTIYVGTDQRSFMAVRPDGSIKWEYFSGNSFNRFFASPAIAPDGTIITASEEAIMYAFRPDGSLRWSQPGAAISSLAIDRDGNIYGAFDQAIRSYTIDGNLRWSLPTAGSDTVGQPAIGPDGTLYVTIGFTGRHELWAVVPEPGAVGLLLPIAAHFIFRRPNARRQLP